MRQIKQQLLDSAIEALFPMTATDTAEFVRAARNTDGNLNSLAWSQLLSQFLWFGFDGLALYEEVLISALQEEPDFPAECLVMRSADVEFQAMTKAIDSGMPTGLVIEMVEALRSSLEIMATVIRDCGEPIEPLTLPRLLAMADELDEQVNLRIEGEVEWVNESADEDN